MKKLTQSEIMNPNKSFRVKSLLWIWQIQYKMRLFHRSITIYNLNGTEVTFMLIRKPQKWYKQTTYYNGEFCIMQTQWMWFMFHVFNWNAEGMAR